MAAAPPLYETNHNDNAFFKSEVATWRIHHETDIYFVSFTLWEIFSSLSWKDYSFFWFIIRNKSEEEEGKFSKYFPGGGSFFFFCTKICFCLLKAQLKLHIKEQRKCSTSEARHEHESQDIDLLQKKKKRQR